MINDKNYSVGLYIRLSREDENKTDVSESITNQKSLLLQYVKENNLRVYDIYIDDGYSGTTFDRPGFNRLINDIENKLVNMVITKDMSRLGRDYIKTGYYLEKYFPEHNIRYIAITDNIDTYLDNSNNDIAPFKAIMNDYYAKDISKKIKSSLRAKQKEGKWVGSRCPYGYDKDINNKNHLVINEEQAGIVRYIFDLCLNGLTCFKIANKLTLENIKTPAQYYNFNWKNNYNMNIGKWHPKTIKDILTNRLYTGDLVQNRRSKVNYKIKKVVCNKECDYIVVPNTHEAIIDKELFDRVQSLIPKNVGRNEKRENHLLDGLLYCGECNHRISVSPRRKIDNRCYTVCNYYRTYLKQKVCTMHSNNYDILENKILELLKEYCLKYMDKKSILNRVINTNNDKQNNLKYIKNLEKEISNINDNLDSIYIDRLNKNISEEQFNRVKIKLETELNIKLDKIKEFKKEKTQNNNIDREKYIREVLELNNISRDIIINLIDRIEIFEDKQINLILKFNI
mgnify:FL=1